MIVVVVVVVGVGVDGVNIGVAADKTKECIYLYSDYI